MSDLNPRDEMTSPTVRLDAKTIAHLTAYPSLLVPPAVRPALLECWAAHRTMKGLETNSFAIAVPLSIWIEREGLLPEDAAEILRSMQSTSCFSQHVFADQLLATLAARCKAAIARRAAEAEAELRRKETATKPATPEEAALIHEQLAKLTSTFLV